MRYGLLRKNEEVFPDDSFFEEWFGLPAAWDQRGRQCMRTDIKEVGTDYVLDIDLPGFEKKNIALSLENGYLTVSAHQEASDEEKDNHGKYIRRERYAGSLSRSFYVGDLKEEAIKATYDKGILSVSFPKELPPEKSAKKEITIQ